MSRILLWHIQPALSAGLPVCSQVIAGSLPSVFFFILSGWHTPQLYGICTA